MARADSTVRVDIIGDAKSLQSAASQSEKAIGGIGKAAKVAAGVFAGAFVVDKILDFGQTAVAESDRVGDATLRLKEQLGGLSAPVIAASDDFARLGQSEGDMLELQARIADMGTAAGIADEKLAPMATSVGETAAALALIGDADAATIVDLIGKAALGSDRPLKDLGINLTDAEVAARALANNGGDAAIAMTDGELAAARLQIIMEKLAPRVADVANAERDLESAQSELDARFETFTGKVGVAVEGPLTDLLTAILAGIDAVEGLSKGTHVLVGDFAVVVGWVQTLIGWFVDLVGILEDALRLIGGMKGPGWIGADMSVGSTGGGTSQSPDRAGAVIQVQGGSPEIIERAVQNAINTYNARNLDL